jgi:hypothetical protein
MAFCTLFNTAYLTRGLALYESLMTHMPTAQLYVVCFDQRCYEILQQLQLPQLTPIALADFEDDALLVVKPTRNMAEYCWTCTPSVVRYVMQQFQLQACTYVDADIYFFTSPQPLLDLGSDHVSITPHRYTPCYDQSATSGIYCVQFMTFANTKQGMMIVNWWRDACIDWCYARSEDGKFGDQKYLDDWPERFAGVKVLNDPGAGVAPWNVQQYQIDDLPHAMVNANTQAFEMIFYHFHGLKFYTPDKIDIGPYRMNVAVRQKIYQPYINHLKRIEHRLRRQGVAGNISNIKFEKYKWRTMLKRRLIGTYHIMQAQEN